MLRKIFATLMSLSILANGSAMQAPKPAEQSATVSPKPAMDFGLEDGTPVKLKLNRNLLMNFSAPGGRVEHVFHARKIFATGKSRLRQQLAREFGIVTETLR